MNTPTPLTIRETPNDTDFYCEINDGLGEAICSVYVHPKSDIKAAEIVRAVYYHDRMVDELVKLSEEYKKLFTIYVKHGNPNFTFDMCDGVANNNPNYVSAQQLLTEIEKSK